MFPASLRKIGDKAFCDCWKLSQVSFRDGSELEAIGEQAFRNTGLKAFEAPASLREIGDRAFADCAALTVARVSAGTGLDTRVIFGSGIKVEFAE